MLTAVVDEVNRGVGLLFAIDVHADRLIDFHSGNEFPYCDLRVSPANKYMEHFPYIDSLWFGEFFNFWYPSKRDSRTRKMLGPRRWKSWCRR